MSNEYKDWYNDLSEEQRNIYELCMEFPFLLPRKADGTIDEDFDYKYLNITIPKGWSTTFIEMCKRIKPLLEKEGVSDSFYFVEVKEKYNTLRCYTNEYVSDELQDIIREYENKVRFICSECGRPATYVTTDYELSYCTNCWKDKAQHQKVEPIDIYSKNKI